MKRLLILTALAACGDNTVLDNPDAPPRPDAMPDAMPDAPRMVRIDGNVDFNGGLVGIPMDLLGTSQIATTNVNGDWFFDVPEGSRAIVRANPVNNPELFPMIRGVIAADHLRPRVFYLAGPPEVGAASAFGKSFDANMAIVEVDFRNAQIGGYTATLTVGGAPLTPEFGMVLDDNGNPVLGTSTVAGGSGSTLLLANLQPNTAVSFAAVVPAGATLPCQVRDADPLPLMAGTVTWVDFECGNGTD